MFYSSKSGKIFIMSADQYPGSGDWQNYLFDVLICHTPFGNAERHSQHNRLLITHPVGAFFVQLGHRLIAREVLIGALSAINFAKVIIKQTGSEKGKKAITVIEAAMPLLALGVFVVCFFI